MMETTRISFVVKDHGTEIARYSDLTGAIKFAKDYADRTHHLVRIWRVPEWGAATLAKTVGWV